MRISVYRCLAVALIASSLACQKKKAEVVQEDWPVDPAPKATPAPSAQPSPVVNRAVSIEPRADKDKEPETVDGYRVIRAKDKDGNMTSIAVQPPKGWDIMAAPTEPDPEGGKFTLAQAEKGLPKDGTFAAQIRTNMGSFYCDLFADKAPNTVANFVGLARGLRKFWDADKAAWVARPYYDATTFHRVIPEFMIQGGDYTGTGRGSIGYTIPDEVNATLHHDRPGQLCMANRGANTNEAQFFITEGAAPHLEGSYTIFGQCEPTTLVQRIARVPQGPENKPLTPVKIERVEIRRLVGGMAKWMPASAKLPPMPGVPAPGRAVEVKKP